MFSLIAFDLDFLDIYKKKGCFAFAERPFLLLKTGIVEDLSFVL
jgi:hypothetical protein